MLEFMSRNSICSLWPPAGVGLNSSDSRQPWSCESPRIPEDPHVQLLWKRQTVAVIHTVKSQLSHTSLLVNLLPSHIQGYTPGCPYSLVLGCSEWPVRRGQ
ncbi:hypothetical protein SKAU_G00174940 [Synaphobranchus kaupii]|uniref:Uncharacterized protein n=1 Tax=Synaphobranchus kaupii TaxID=118154 RepID=A0A9Q1FLQ1_SYNKA|nr:hypothetical protein SKAU_G00174940 [Synaphobranchus kaupii]